MGNTRNIILKISNDPFFLLLPYVRMQSTNWLENGEHGRPELWLNKDPAFWVMGCLHRYRLSLAEFIASVLSSALNNTWYKLSTLYLPKQHIALPFSQRSLLKKSFISWFFISLVFLQHFFLSWAHNVLRGRYFFTYILE